MDENKKSKKSSIRIKRKNVNKNFTTPEVIILVLISLIVGLVFGKVLSGKRDAYTFIKSNDKYINKFVDNYYKELDREELIDNAISGMMQTLDDPYSVYLDENESNNFNITLDGSYKGLGLQIQKNEETGYMIISSIFKNSPAEVAGLEINDQIVSIDGVDSKDLSASEFSSIVRTSNNKSFKLVIIRNDEELEIVVNKETVVLDSVLSKSYDIDSKKVGYIYIGIFANNTYIQFKSELEKLEAEKIDYLIIDVRSNTGGHLTTVDSILDLFLNSNQVMYQFEKNGKIKKTYGKGKESKNYEIILLGNEMSASASEVLIAGLSENLNCKFIGKKTYGKGTVQEMVDLSDGNQYKITVKKWLTPKGNWVNDTVGIIPDYEVDLGETYLKTKEEKDDNQLNKAFEYIRENG